MTTNETGQMERRKAIIEKRLADLDGIEQRERERYPSWAITGRSGRAYAKRQKGAAERVDRSIERAKEYTVLHHEKEGLERAIDDIVSGKRGRRAEMESLVQLQSVIDFIKIKAGDEVMIPCGNTVTVVKKNPKSLVTASGGKWSLAEFAGIRSQDADSLLQKAYGNPA